MSVCLSSAAVVCQEEYKPDVVISTIYLSVPTLSPLVPFDSLKMFNKSYLPRHVDSEYILIQHQPHDR